MNFGTFLLKGMNIWFNSGNFATLVHHMLGNFPLPSLCD